MIQKLRIIPFWTFVLDIFSAILSAGNSEITDTETRTKDGPCAWVCAKTPRLIDSSHRAGGLDLLGGVKLMKGVRVLFCRLESDLGVSTATEDIHALDCDSCEWGLS